MDIQFNRCNTRAELEQILSLQRRNLPNMLTEEEKNYEGFVTVTHSLELLDKMNRKCPHIIAKSGKELAGYALCMHPLFAEEIPVLKPMFEKIISLIKPVSNYMVMGQICIDKTYRKQGLFRGIYNYMRSELESDYDSIITEVDAENTRSLTAHYSIGFRDLLVYTSDKHRWHLIRWELK